MEKWVRHEKIYSGKVVSLQVGEVECEDGTIATREVVEHPGGVGIVPLLGDSVILVRQYRIAISQDVLEIPAGKLEGIEDVAVRARLELEEETGYRAGRLVPAGSIYASVGYTSEEVRLFLAFDIEDVGQKLEFDECIEVVKVSLARAREMLAANEIKDAKTIVGLQRLFQYIENGVLE